MATKPRTFFLNERHESHDEYIGRGSLPKYVEIEWPAKAKRISTSIDQSLSKVRRSKDPLRDRQFFLIAQPDTSLKKSSDSKDRPGVHEAPADFSKVMHSRAFARLGLDLLDVTDSGMAVVHGDSDIFTQLLARSSKLDSLGARERARWAAISEFSTLPIDIRVDIDWLQGLRSDELTDVIFELQPVLSRVDVDTVVRAIADFLVDRPREKLTTTGADFSGRAWIRGKVSSGSVRTLIRDFYSLQSAHPPQYSIVMAAKGRKAKAAPSPAKNPVAVDPRSLPCVAVVDLGVPMDHLQLSSYRRGTYIAPGLTHEPLNDHGCFVASRVVFGEHETVEGLEAAEPTCSYYDVIVGDRYLGELFKVDDKVIPVALSTVVANAPDVRVFNISIGDFRPMEEFQGVEAKERRLLLQELDNFAFFNDVILVVAAGNSAPGAVPNPMYPKNFEDDSWALGPYASGYNTLVCGSFAGKFSAEALAQKGWPSPFTRIGPGVSRCPIPSFSAEGGNASSVMSVLPGFGVLGYSGTGHVEDRNGTSFSAPIVAREAALAFSHLQQHCPPGTRPFAVTVRAFLALTATPPTNDVVVAPLVKRTLGFGKPHAEKLVNPAAGSAVILWQGILESPRDLITVQVPVPMGWLAAAKTPILRLIVCHDSPVNEVAKDVWACRKVSATLKASPEPDSVPVKGSHSKHAHYPISERIFPLGDYGPSGSSPAADDLWYLDVHYEEKADNPPGRVFDSLQRVAVAVQLLDDDAHGVDPQAALQALPAAAEMRLLSALATPVRTPVIVRTTR